MNHSCQNLEPEFHSAVRAPYQFKRSTGAGPSSPTGIHSTKPRVWKPLQDRPAAASSDKVQRERKPEDQKKPKRHINPMQHLGNDANKPSVKIHF